MYSHMSRGLAQAAVKEKSINARSLRLSMSFLPRFASYRFRLSDDAAQRTFALPDYLSQRRLSGFYLRQEPSHRASYECGHSLRVNVSAADKLTFDLGGIADWEH